MVKASVTMTALIFGLSDQPITSLLNKPMTMAKYSQPSPVALDVAVVVIEKTEACDQANGILQKW